MYILFIFIFYIQDYQRGQVCKLLQIYIYIYYIYIYTSLIQRHSHLQNYQTLLRIETRPVTLFYCLHTFFNAFLLTYFLPLLEVFLQFHCIFQYILFVGFQCVLSSIFLLHVSYHFRLFPPWVFAPFPLVSCIFNVFFQDFYPSSSFSDGFCNISSGCYHIFFSLHFSSIVQWILHDFL